MMTGQLAFPDRAPRSQRIPVVDWPAYNSSLVAAFKQLLSTPTWALSLKIVGEMTLLHGDWIAPTTGAALERAKRKGMAGCSNAANKARRARRKRARLALSAETGDAEPEAEQTCDAEEEPEPALDAKEEPPRFDAEEEPQEPLV